jgi:predicted transcriptional regulator
MAWIAEQVLTAINESGMRECITEARLIDLTDLTKRKVQESCRRLCNSGLLVKTDEGCHTITPAGMEALAAGAKYRSGPKDGKHNGKRIWKNTTRILIWRAIRLRRKFSVPEIIALVADETNGDMTSNVQKYVRALANAGYLIELPKREAGTSLTSNGYKRWWLQDDKDTGPEAPVWRAGRGTVFDPNTNVEVSI